MTALLYLYRLHGTRRKAVQVRRAHVFKARPSQIRKFMEVTQFVKFMGTLCTFRFKDLLKNVVYNLPSG